MNNEYILIDDQVIEILIGLVLIQIHKKSRKKITFIIKYVHSSDRDRYLFCIPS